MIQERIILQVLAEKKRGRPKKNHHKAYAVCEAVTNGGDFLPHAGRKFCKNFLPAKE